MKEITIVTILRNGGYIEHNTAKDTVTLFNQGVPVSSFYLSNFADVRDKGLLYRVKIQGEVETWRLEGYVFRLVE